VATGRGVAAYYTGGLTEAGIASYNVSQAKTVTAKEQVLWSFAKNQSTMVLLTGATNLAVTETTGVTALDNAYFRQPTIAPTAIVDMGNLGKERFPNSVQMNLSGATPASGMPIRTGPPIGIPGVNSVAEYTARLEAMQHAEVTGLMQQHVTAVSNTVDGAGMFAFTRGQRQALALHPELQPAFRGNRIDVMARGNIMRDSTIQGMLPGLRSFYTKGPDFYQPSTFRWWDMTTFRQWGAHQTKYGGNGTLLQTR